MSRKSIPIMIERKLYAESLGRCLNPDCHQQLFINEGEIGEKAHIVPYEKTQDNTYDNLIVLCPNCHTNFDKNAAFTDKEVKNWKKIRQDYIEEHFSVIHSSFESLSEDVVPLLMKNKEIYENYFLKDNKKLWIKHQDKILVNNKKLEVLFKKNRHLIQANKSYQSNVDFIEKFFTHVDEFESSRNDEEIFREVLFPKEINSMFGIAPFFGDILPSTESLENFIEECIIEGKEVDVFLEEDIPYMEVRSQDKKEKIYLKDEPRIRQIYFNTNSFRKVDVRLESLCFILKYLKKNGIEFHYKTVGNLREIILNNTDIKFIYNYCLSKVELVRLSPVAGSVIVNLHNWNGEKSISNEAYELAEILKVTLLTQDNFYRYAHENKN